MGLYSQGNTQKEKRERKEESKQREQSFEQHINKNQNRIGLNVQSRGTLSKFSIAIQQDSMKLLKTISDHVNRSMDISVNMEQFLS